MTDHDQKDGPLLSIPVLNTKGAARRLGCSETWIHKLAATGKLKAYSYGDEGELIEYAPTTSKPGRALYFLAEDVAHYRPRVQRRPRGSKNKRKTFTGGEAQENPSSIE